MRLLRHSGWLCIMALAGVTACGVPGIPKPPSLDLPQPVTDLRAVRKGDRVYLAWTAPTETTDNLPLHHTGGVVVCRSPGAMYPGCAGGVLPVSQPQPPAQSKSTFIDAIPASLLGSDPDRQIFYAVSILNRNYRDAGISNVVSVPAVAAPAAPSDFQAQVTADGVVVSWKETPATGARHFYRVYRRAEGTTTDAVAGEATWGSFQLIDHNFEWEKTYWYRATVVTVVHVEGKPDSEFESADTLAVKVFAHDVFPPAVPSGLQAVFSGVGQQPFIDLIWAPDTDADLAGYNIYRREEGGEAKKISSGIVTTPAFRDMHVMAGHTYFYSVAAVDVRGNESARCSETSEAAP
ncbi:MAG: hypothetical protein ACLPOO_19345 [Terriglobales bacterium]